jgi:hypothetical protein
MIVAAKEVEMNERRINIEHIPNLEGLPSEYHGLEQCQMGLGWSTYAQAQADEQQALQQLYADLLHRADESDFDDE